MACNSTLLGCSKDAELPSAEVSCLLVNDKICMLTLMMAPFPVAFNNYCLMFQLCCPQLCTVSKSDYLPLQLFGMLEAFACPSSYASSVSASFLAWLSEQTLTRTETTCQ